MTQRTAQSSFISGLLEARGPATTPLDSAAEYIRARIDRVLPLYLLAMTPHAIAMTMLIDALVGEQRSRIATDCIYLSLAMLWRWVWLARLQFCVQQDLRDRNDAGFWKRVLPILRVRLFSNIAVTWGGIIVFPAFFGLYAGSFIAPFYLEDPSAPLPKLKQLFAWIKPSSGRLTRAIYAMAVLGLTLTIALFATQIFLTRMLLPSFLGVDTVDLNLTLGSWAWRFRAFYCIFLVLDGFWTVAAVFLYYDSQSRRMASDLRARLNNLIERPQ